MDFLNELFYGLPCRFVLYILFLILPVLSFGQLFHTDANAIPIVGLENLYSVHQKKIEPCLFVTSNTIITKSEGTTLFVNGLIQKDTLFVTYSDIITFPATRFKAAKQITNPALEVATTTVRKSGYQPAFPAFPWKKNPLPQEIYFAAVSVISALNTRLVKKMDNRPFHLHQSYANLLKLAYKTSCYSLFFTTVVTKTYGKNVAEFSSRPPPVSTPI